MYSVADTLLRWDEISLQRDLFKKATYTAFTLYTLCTERLTGTWGPQFQGMYSSGQHVWCPNSGAITNCTWNMNKRSGRFRPDPGKIIQNSLCFQSLVSRQARGEFSTAQGQPIHLATLRTEDLGAPHQFSEYTADPSNLNPVPNNIGHNHLVSVGLVLISNSRNT